MMCENCGCDNMKDCKPLDTETRELWMRKRQLLLIELGALEEYLGLKRSVATRKEKRQQRTGEEPV